MNKFRKIMVTVVAMALLVMGGTAVFAQQEDGGSSPITQQADDGQGDFAGPNENGDLEGRPDGEENNCFLDREAVSIIIADALGITVEELEAAHEEGVRLPELAESLGVEIEVVEAAIESARAEALAQAVADGIITQEEADEIASHTGRGNHPPRGERGDGENGSTGRSDRLQNGEGAPDGAPEGNPNVAPAGSDA